VNAIPNNTLILDSTDPSFAVGPPSLPTPSSIHLPPGVYRTGEVVLLPGAIGPVPLQCLDPAPLHLFTSGVYRTGEVVLLPGAVGPVPLQ
jgi:hypothetical protein